MPVCVTKIEKELRTFLRGAELAAKGVSNGWWARVCQQGPLCISQANRRFFPAIEEIRITRSSTELSCSCSLGTAGKIFHVAVASTDLHLKLEQYCKGSLWYIDQRDLGFKNLNAVLVLRLFTVLEKYTGTRGTSTRSYQSPSSKYFLGLVHLLAAMPTVELHTGSNIGTHNGAEIKSGKQSYVNNEDWDHATEIFEYVSSANPAMLPIPIHKLDATSHTTGPSRVTALDVSKAIGITNYPATSPNLLASFVRICVGESVKTNACATSQAFYVIHGRGQSQSGLGVVEWNTGDLFVFPSSSEESPCTHLCVDDEGTGGAGLYWVSDAPLLSYLGVVPKVQKFKPAYFSRKLLLDNVESVRHEPGAQHRNRLGILLGNKETPDTKTLTHVLWSLLNVLPAGEVQRPHRHNSVALDLAVHAPPGTYTLMGKELDSRGWVKDPVRVEWTTGSIFITPPGWWHSHHNDSEEEAWVLPIQDAGLYTHQRTLDIRFSENEVANKKE